MATKTFTSFVQLEAMMNQCITQAVGITCNKLLAKLQELIELEYYNAYDTETYNRSYQFYKSAMTEMLSSTSGMIFMNPDAMDYPFSGRGWSWDGATQIIEANEGVHGGWSTTESLQHRYWDEFEIYCDKNALKILKQELVKQGLKPSK